MDGALYGHRSRPAWLGCISSTTTLKDETMDQHKKIWAQVPPLPKDMLAKLVGQYESAGLEGIWTPQTYGAPFLTLSAAAMASDKLKLGTGIALAFARSPLETALNIIDLDYISGGRAVLGLGSSAKSLIDAFGMEYGKPLAHMREVLGLIRTIVEKGHSGELGVLEGEYHRLDLSHFRNTRPALRTSIPIYLPAIFEKAVEQAGELADGLLAHPLLCEKWIEDQLDRNLKAGLEKGGRQRADIDVNLMVFVAINDDKRQAIEDTRTNIAFYSQSPQYLRYFEAIGFGSEAKAIQDAFARNDFAAMNAACSDEMVEAIALVGPADVVRKRMAVRAAHADSITPVVPQFGLSAEQTEFYGRNIAEVFYG